MSEQVVRLWWSINIHYAFAVAIDYSGSNGRLQQFEFLLESFHPPPPNIFMV